MNSALDHLVDYCIARNCVISVDDGGAWPVRYSNDRRAIIEAARSVFEARLVIRGLSAEHIASVLVIPSPAVDPDEEVADFSDNDFMTAWWGAFDTGAKP